MADGSTNIQITPEFSEALAAMRRGENVLITGNAGTGKSTLLRMFLDDRAAGDLLVAAPTGVAALNIGGYTIHRAFGFRPGLYPEDLRPGGRWRPSSNVKAVLRSIRVLIVDEVSMVRADLFDMMDIALQTVRNTSESFGGVQVILIGDLLQLPPVVTRDEEELFSTFWDSPYYFSAKAHDALDIRHINLTKVWRQTDDTYIEILNEVREGSLGEQGLQVLNQQVAPGFTPPNDWVTLASRNSRVAKINSQRLNELPGTKYVSNAVFTGEATAKSFNGAETLEYARGARVMTLINDPDGRFVNGSFGEIVEASPEQLVVRLDTGPIVLLRKHTWTIGRPVVVDGKITSSAIGTVKQFPVNLAWAITIHKSQGQTIPKLFIDLSGGTSQDGQFYVALSRGVDLENIRLSAPVTSRHIRANNMLVRRVRRASAGITESSRFLALSAEGVDFSISQHVALVHAVVVDDGKIVADFGSWVNPGADLGDFGVKHNIPSGGLALAPTLGDFWPLLLRQAEGAVVVGDNLLMIERAVRHQEPGMALNLGVGYDTGELDFVARGNSPAERAQFTARAIINGDLELSRGEPVPGADKDKEGAVFIPEWAPVAPMVLDPLRATESDIAWASLSGGSLPPQDVGEVQECLELMGAWATSRGMWTESMSSEILQRAERALPAEYATPPTIEVASNPEHFLREGTRVAFTGARNLLGGAASDERLNEICEARGLVYKSGVTKTRCDVLVAGDPASMSRKAQAAREYGKPIIKQQLFEQWYRSNGWASAPSDTDAAVAATRPTTMSKPVPAKTEAEPQEASLVSADAVLKPGARVAFRGSTFVFGKLIPQGERLQQFCSDLDLEYKQAVTKTRCDVLVTDDPDSIDGKSGLARRYGIPMVMREEFSTWAESKSEEIIQASEAEAEGVSEVIDAQGNVPQDVPGDSWLEPALDLEQNPMRSPDFVDPSSVYSDEPDILGAHLSGAPDSTNLPVEGATSFVTAGEGEAVDAGVSEEKEPLSGWIWTKRSIKALGVLSVIFIIAALFDVSEPVAITIALFWLLAMAIIVISALVTLVQATKRRFRK